MSSFQDDHERVLEQSFARQFPDVARESLSRDPFSTVTLGYSEALGERLTLDEVERLKHSHTIGTTGSGKTNYLASIIMQDVDRGRGVMVVDPHGGDPRSPLPSSTLYSTVLAHCTQRRLHQAGKLHIVDPSHEGSVSGFNPLAPLPGYRSDVLAMLMRECVERVWRQDIHATPSTARVLLATFATLSELGLTLCEATPLLKREDSGLRMHALSIVRDRLALEVLEELEDLAHRRNPDQFDIKTEGPRNRISEFTNNGVIRSIIGQTKTVLDLVRIMDQGHVILVNLQWSGQNATTHARLLGTILLRYLFALAPRRSNAIPFFVYVDECQNFLTDDIPNLLREVRKYFIGVHLAHQDMQSLLDAGETIKGAVINNTSVKTAFRMTDATDARDLIDRFAPSIDYEMPVQILTKPVAVGQHILWLESHSNAAHRARAQGVTESETQSEGQTRVEGEQHSETNVTSEMIADASTEALSSGESFGMASSDSISQSIMPDMSFMSQGFPTIIGTPTANTLGLSATQSSAASSMLSDSRSHAKMHSEARGRARALGYARSFAVADSKAFSLGLAQSRSQSTGETSSAGRAQALATIYQDLPTAVHSRENVLDMLARTIIGLSPGEAFITIPGRSTRIRVPLITTPELSQHDRQRLIEETLTGSPYALPRNAAEKCEIDRVGNLAAETMWTVSETPDPVDWSERYMDPKAAEPVIDAAIPRSSADGSKPSKPILVIDNDLVEDKPDLSSE